MKINREDLAWAGGFYEGEGNICASRQTNRSGRSISVTVTQVHIEPLERFRNIVGLGAIELARQTQRGKRRPLYRWGVFSYERSQATMAMLWPWLSSRRREQALAALRSVQAEWKPRQVLTHCKHGHEFTEANTRVNRDGSRTCRACRREWAARDYLTGHPLLLKREWLKRKRERLAA